MQIENPRALPHPSFLSSPFLPRRSRAAQHLSSPFTMKPSIPTTTASAMRSNRPFCFNSLPPSWSIRTTAPVVPRSSHPICKLPPSNIEDGTIYGQVFPAKSACRRPPHRAKFTSTISGASTAARTAIPSIPNMSPSWSPHPAPTPLPQNGRPSIGMPRLTKTPSATSARLPAPQPSMPSRAAQQSLSRPASTPPI